MIDLDRYCSRQDAIRQAGTTSSHLAYLEGLRIVQGHRIGQSRKPTCLYTPDQVCLIKAAANCWFLTIEAIKEICVDKDPYMAAKKLEKMEKTWKAISKV